MILELFILLELMTLLLDAVAGLVVYCLSNLFLSMFCWFSNSFFTFWYL